MYLLCCNICGKMYKAKRHGNKFITDFGDVIDSCLCGGGFTIIKTDDWIADLVFKIKG